MRIPYGVDRLPRDPYLRSVEVHGKPLRLNTEPVPPDAMPLLVGTHEQRVAAATEWLQSQCGDYAPLRRQFIERYFEFIQDEVGSHRAELAERLRPFDGLYAPEDFTWSAFRPLPRAWIVNGDRLTLTDMVYWDGKHPIIVDLKSPRWPEPLHRFWVDQNLPSSPFRRSIP